MDGGRRHPRPHTVRGHSVKASTRKAHTVKRYYKPSLGEDVHGYMAPAEHVRAHYVHEHVAAGYKSKTPANSRSHHNPWQDFLRRKAREDPSLTRPELAQKYADEYHRLHGGAKRRVGSKVGSKRVGSKRAGSRVGSKRRAPVRRRAGASGHTLY